MGCFHSKKENSDLHPNVFRVVNIDENGADLCSGQLEITESDIILYREGRDSTIWPLHSLRRYGFEGDIFSFESGRRCETGEGIYAFRCRRASLLFRTLQQQIQLRNIIHESVPYPVSRLTPSPQGRQTLQATVVHRSSIDNGQPENVRPVMNNNLPNILNHDIVPHTVNQSPRSPSSADILEVMPLYPRNQSSTNHVTNVYQFREFKREHNNNQALTAATDTRHLYSNDLNRDLAILRNTLRQEAALNTIRDIEDETRFLESRYLNENVNKLSQANTPLSPTLSNSSEHYAQLSLEQQELTRLYMNIAANEANIPEIIKNDAVPTTPLTPKQVEYCNISIGSKLIETVTYANLSLGEGGDKNSSESKIDFKSGQKSMTQLEEIEVNYAVLDIDSNKQAAIIKKEIVNEIKPVDIQPHSNIMNESGSSSRRRVAPQPSAEQEAAPAVGYTTIDFDKTVALTSVAAGDVDLDGPRKTRHNSCSVICGSPSTTDKH